MNNPDMQSSMPAADQPNHARGDEANWGPASEPGQGGAAPGGVEQAEAQRGAAAIPLYVDLDGTLITTDILWESLISLVRHQPWQLWRVPLWGLKGRAYLKQRLAEHAVLDPASLPYRAAVLELIEQARADGRPVHLATATHEHVAERVAEHLGVFDDVLATRPGHNLKGRAKLEAIQGRQPGVAFDYVGDSHADLSVWAGAQQSYVAAPSKRIMRAAQRQAIDLHPVGQPRGAALRQLPRTLRVHQWVKNVLVFVPLAVSHSIVQLDKLWLAIAAFFAFSFTASGVYIINDLLDAPDDRHHARKRHRPFAAGTLSVPTGLALGAGVFAIAGALSALALPAEFGLILLGYLVLTTLYSTVLKRKVLVDVLCLAGLYTVRIIAGGVAVDVPPSTWLLAFSMFLFLNLAFVKRYCELLQLREDGAEQTLGRGYLTADLSVVRTLGISSGFLSVLVLSMYMNSDAVQQLYSTPALLWLTAPVLLYWIARMWLLAERRQLDEDPVLFAIRDRLSLAAAATVAGVALAAWFV